MTTWDKILLDQKGLCGRIGAIWQPVSPNSFIAFNESLFTSIQPINGLRHPTQGTTDGWYIWSGGEIPQGDHDFFDPIHVGHLIEKKPIILQYLAMPPGWRFQIDETGYEDIWFDESLLLV